MAERSCAGAGPYRRVRDSPRNSPLGPRKMPLSKRVPARGVTGPPSVRGPNMPRNVVPSVAKHSPGFPGRVGSFACASFQSSKCKIAWKPISKHKNPNTMI